jgi:hypothetical protein
MAAGAVLAAALIGIANPALATLTLDLRPSASQSSGVTVDSANNKVTLSSLTPVNLDIFAKVTGQGSADEGFGGLFAGFLVQAGSAASPTQGKIAAQVTPTVQGTGGNPTTWGYDGYPSSTRNGASTDIGAYNRIGPDPSAGASHLSPNGWFFAAYQETEAITNNIKTIDFSADNVLANGKEFKIGTLTFTPSTLGSGANTAVISAFRRNRPEADILPAVWVEDATTTGDKGVKTPPIAGSASTGPDYVIGSSVVIDVQTATALAGDITGPNGTPDGIVNQLDLNVITGNWQKTGTGVAGDITGPSGSPDGIVNQLDLNVITGNWQKTGGGAAFGVSAVPEPSMIGLVGVAGLASMRRRSRK